MATQFTLSQVEYANTPSGPQTWTFQYKLFSDPDSAYVTISSSTSVDTSGNLVPPLTVTGLTAGQLYYVRAFNNCSSPVLYYITSIQM